MTNDELRVREGVEAALLEYAGAAALQAVRNAEGDRPEAVRALQSLCAADEVLKEAVFVAGCRRLVVDALEVLTTEPGEDREARVKRRLEGA